MIEGRGGRVAAPLARSIKGENMSNGRATIGDVLGYRGPIGGVWSESISGGRSSYAAAKNTIALRAAYAIGGAELRDHVRAMIIERRAYELGQLTITARRWQGRARRARSYVRRGFSAEAVRDALATRDRYTRAEA